METILADTSNSAIIEAIEANTSALFALFKKWPRAEVHDSPELLWTITDIPYPLFNSVLRARLPTDAITEAIDETIARYKSRNVPMMWWIGPSTQPSNLGRLLAELGLQASVSPGMAIDLNVLLESTQMPVDLKIKRVESKAELHSWSRVMTSVFGNPGFVAEAIFDLYLNLGLDIPCLNYIGTVEGEVVATSSLYLGAGVAGMYNVTTKKSARRRGIGAAMTRVPLLEARSFGYRIGTLHSSDSGFNVYRKLGFQEYCKIYQYIWRGDK